MPESERGCFSLRRRCVKSDSSQSEAFPGRQDKLLQTAGMRRNESNALIGLIASSARDEANK